MKKRLKKYEMAELRREARKLARKGLSRKEIAEQLNADGFRMCGGERQIPETYVSHLTVSRKYKRRATPTVRAVTKNRITVSDTVVGVLTDPVLSDKQKVGMLEAYFNVVSA